MTDTIAPPQTCRNCAAALAGPYCAQCGQKDRPLNPSLFSLAGDALAEMFDVDGKLLRSIRLLFTRPGFLSNELLAGRRARYVSPLRLYLVFSLILFVASTVVANRALVMPSQGNTIYLGMGASINWDERPGDRERTIAQGQRMIETRAVWLPRAMFVVVPVMAFFVMVLTWGSRRQYPLHLQFTTHVQAVVFASFALVVCLPQLPPGDIAEVWKSAWGLALVRTAIPVAILGYVLIAFRNVYGGSWLLNALRTVVVSFLFGVMFIAAGNAILMYGFRNG